jgi:SpoVK/Ycf46/Vps4 family AAA+-type ATPase
MVKVSMADIDQAIPSIPTSALKEFVIDVPKTSWDDVGGLNEARRSR